MVEVLDAATYRFASLLAKSASYDVREMGWSAIADADLVKVGPKGYIHGWIYVGARPKVGRIVRQTKRDHDGKVVTVRTGRVSKVEDGHVHVSWDGGGTNRVEHVHAPGRTGGLSARAEHAEAAKTPHPYRPAAKPRKSAAEPAAKPAARDEHPTPPAVESAAKPKRPKKPRTPPEPKPTETATPHGTLADHVASGVKSRRRLAGGAMGQTSRVELNDGSSAVHKVTKSFPTRDAKAQQDAEELAALVADRLGVRAPRVHRVADDEVYQDLMPGKSAEQAFPDDFDTLYGGTPSSDKELSRIIGSDDGLRLGLFDLLIGNNDRYGGNWLVGPDGKPTAIDHGMAFQSGDARSNALGGKGPFRTLLYDHRAHSLRDTRLSSADIAEVRKQLEGVRDQFTRMGRADWYDQMVRRLDEVSAHAKGTKKVLT